MSKPPIVSSTYSPGVMSLIPLYYVGWADSVLSPSEVELIRQKIEALPFLTAADKKLLHSWSRPDHPPPPGLFKHWVRLLQGHAQQIPINKRISLSELGLEMARQTASGTETAPYWSSSGTREALEEMEQIMGIGDLQSFRNIFSHEQRAKEAEEIIDKPGFDVAALQALLDDDYPKLRQRMRTLLSDPTFNYQVIREKTAYRQQVMDWCKLLAEQGLGAISYPKKYGGRNSMGEYAVVFEMLGYHDLSLLIKFGVQFGLFGGSVLALGTKYHHDKYLKDVGTLDLPGCFAMTETGHGSNVRSLQTTATYDKSSDELIIHTPTENDGKEYIGNALHGQMATVFAQLIVEEQQHGVHAILVPLRDEEGQMMPGIRAADCGYKLGLNGIDNGRLWFDQVRVPRKNLLNRFGNIDKKGRYTSPIENPSKRFFTMLGTLVGGRVCVPRAGLSAAKSGLTIAIRYALKRRQFAPKDGEQETILLDYPSHQLRLMPLLARAYALDFAHTWLSEKYAAGKKEDIREIETLAAGLKSYSTWFTTHCLQECREACGGKGYLAENRFADLKADTDIFTTFEGDNTVLMQLVAKGLLSSFRQEFHNEGFRAVLRFLGEQFTTSVTQLNPYTIRKTDVAHLRDTEFHLAAFRYRERKTVVAISQRMRNLLKKRIDPYDAFLRCQNHIIELAHAYIERVILERFVATLEANKAKQLNSILKTLCDVFALSTIDQHKGWYLEQEYMTGGKTKAIRRVYHKLCKDLRGEAAFLVDAFAIPEACLAAPIIID